MTWESHSRPTRRAQFSLNRICTSKPPTSILFEHVGTPFPESAYLPPTPNTPSIRKELYGIFGTVPTVPPSREVTNGLYQFQLLRPIANSNHNHGPIANSNDDQQLLRPIASGIQQLHRPVGNSIIHDILHENDVLPENQNQKESASIHVNNNITIDVDTELTPVSSRFAPSSPFFEVDRSSRNRKLSFLHVNPLSFEQQLLQFRNPAKNYN
jgi:hypothetical protein